MRNLVFRLWNLKFHVAIFTVKQFLLVPYMEVTCIINMLEYIKRERYYANIIRFWGNIGKPRG